MADAGARTADPRIRINQAFEGLCSNESLTLREGKTDRWIRMNLSLAFLAPDIVKAAIEGHLPRGFGLKRLVDLPMAWPAQWQALELEAPARG
jgi:site-specific DNA recombinase